MKTYIEESEFEILFREGVNGICLSCGCTQDGVEPDAMKYSCICCGENEVFGLEVAMLLDRLTFKKPSILHDMVNKNENS